MIAFLHTAKVHIDRFENIVKSIDNTLPTTHYVNDALLEKAFADGKTDSKAFKHQIEAIQQTNPTVIICTCSTYGEESDAFDNVYRIDRPIVEYIVNKFDTIGLVYTANSTKDISTRLILDTAKQLNRSIHLINCDCSAHWQHFEHGDLKTYETQIANSIKAIETQVEVVFLAQASMEGAKHYLKDFKKAVVSSPEYGVKSIIGHTNS